MLLIKLPRVASALALDRRAPPRELFPHVAFLDLHAEPLRAVALADVPILRDQIALAAVP